MAVVKVHMLHTNEWTEPRNFHPPKRADLKYWWREAQKSQYRLPNWHESFRPMAEIAEDGETIIWDLRGHAEIIVYMVRKKHLR